jgi:GAF domain-containing protein
VTGTGPGGSESATPAAPAVVALCHEYAALAGAAVAGLAEFLAGAAELAVRLLPTAQSACIRVRVPEVVTAVAAAAGRSPGGSGREVLAIPLVGGGDLAGMLELDSAGRGDFPTDERELAEVLAVLLTLSLGNAA